MCNEGKEDKVNLNCSENDQQWRAEWGSGRGGGGGGVRAEAWWASRGGSSGGRNAREGGRGGRGARRVRREGAGMNEGWKRTPWESRGQLHCSTQSARQQISRLILKSRSCVLNWNLDLVFWILWPVKKKKFSRFASFAKTSQVGKWYCGSAVGGWLWQSACPLKRRSGHVTDGLKLKKGHVAVVREAIKTPCSFNTAKALSIPLYRLVVGTWRAPTWQDSLGRLHGDVSWTVAEIKPLWYRQWRVAPRQTANPRLLSCLGRSALCYCACQIEQTKPNQRASFEYLPAAIGEPPAVPRYRCPD